MRYISIFSGIEAASAAWEPLGWEAVAFAEIESFPSAVLAERYPSVPNLGDVSKIEWKEVIEKHGAVDVLVGGSPCQSFSIAGKRDGLDGASGLMWEYVRAIRDIMPRWIVWENVTGALSSGPGKGEGKQKGEDFGCLLRSLDELGYGLCWRVLDAQFFGVAQRRRRVFLVGRLGTEPPVEVLFEPDGLRWDFESGREKRENLARDARIDVEEDSGGIAAAGFKWHQGAGAGNIAYEEEQAPTLTADWHNPAVIKGDESCLTPWDYQAYRVIDGNGVSPTIMCQKERGAQPPNILARNDVMPFDITQITHPANRSKPDYGDPCGTLVRDTRPPCIVLKTDHMGQNGRNHSVEVSPTLDVASATPVVCMTDTQANSSTDGETCGTLSARMFKDPPLVGYEKERE